MAGFWDAVASAGPYANNLHLAPDRQPHQHLVIITGQMLLLVGNKQTVRQLCIADSSARWTRLVMAPPVHGPMVWNSLPDDLRAQQDCESFTRGLKTWLFSRYYRVQRIRDFRDNSAI